MTPGGAIVVYREVSEVSRGDFEDDDPLFRNRPQREGDRGRRSRPRVHERHRRTSVYQRGLCKQHASCCAVRSGPFPMTLIVGDADREAVAAFIEERRIVDGGAGVLIADRYREVPLHVVCWAVQVDVRLPCSQVDELCRPQHRLIVDDISFERVCEREPLAAERVRVLHRHEEREGEVVLELELDHHRENAREQP